MLTWDEGRVSILRPTPGACDEWLAAVTCHTSLPSQVSLSETLCLVVGIFFFFNAFQS